MSDFYFDEDDTTPEVEEAKRTYRRRLFTYSAKALNVGRSVERIYVYHHSFKSGLKALDRLYQLSGFSRLSNGMLLVGEAGTGKTSLLKLFKSTLPPTNFVDQENGILYMRMQERPSIGRCVGNLLRQLQYPFSQVNRNTVGLKRDILLESMQEKKIRMLMVDEAHHIFKVSRPGRYSSGDAQGGNEVSDLLREMMDDCHLSLVLSGTHTLDKLDFIDPHLHSRVATRIEMKNFGDDEHSGFMKSFSKQVKEVDLSELEKADTCKLLMASTKGNPREIQRLVIEAILVAVDMKKTFVEGADLSTAFNRVYGDDCKFANPFTPTETV